MITFCAFSSHYIFGHAGVHDVKGIFIIGEIGEKGFNVAIHTAITQYSAKRNVCAIDSKTTYIRWLPVELGVRITYLLMLLLVQHCRL